MLDPLPIAPSMDGGGPLVLHPPHLHLHALLPLHGCEEKPRYMVLIFQMSLWVSPKVRDSFFFFKITKIPLSYPKNECCQIISVQISQTL